MDHPMRHPERAIKDFEDLVNVLHRCSVIRLGFNDEDGPYIVPLAFGYEAADGRLSVFVHGAPTGRKAGLLARGGPVTVEADLCHGFRETGHGGVTCEYESLMGTGRAVLLTGADAMHGLRLIMTHAGYAAFPLDESVLPRVQVYRVDLASFTGKRRTV